MFSILHAPLHSVVVPRPPRRTLTLHRSKPLHRLHLSRSISFSDEDLFRSISSSSHGDEDPAHLPGVRSYENDLARLTVVGAVGFDQALTAAAADGGDAAREHLSSGMQTMVVETLFPGSLDDHSTISTRLFLPAKKVNQKAKDLRSRLSSELLSSSVSRNILAMTFRQVVFQHISNVEIVLFPPGTVRDMSNLTNTREIPVHFTMSSSDKLLATLAEVICSFAFNDTVKKHSQVPGSLIPVGLRQFFCRPEVTLSADSSIYLARIPEHAILKEARRRLKNLANWKHACRGRASNKKWLTPPIYSIHGKDDNLCLSSWINEYVPAYQIQIDGTKFKDAKFEGSLYSSGNRWEVLLTHFQMVEFANVLDMFYEDRFTLPQKQIPFGLIERLLSTSRSKVWRWKMYLLPIVCGCLLVSFGIMVRLFAPHILKARKAFDCQRPAFLSDTNFCPIMSLGAVELEPLCISVVERIRDSFAHSGGILFDSSIGAWTGELPSYFRKENGVCEELVCNSEDMKSTSGLADGHALSDHSQSSTGQNSRELSFAEDIASYQVVFTNDGLVVGFQPTNRVAVNYWALNPFAQLLYRGKKLSPGLFEPSLKVPCPDKVILIELLVSVNPKSWFALARQFKV